MDWKLRLRHSAGRVWSAITGEFGREELYFYGGLLLIAIGCWDLWRPASFIVPGMSFVWISMPTRATFMESPPQDSKKG